MDTERKTGVKVGKMTPAEAKCSGTYLSRQRVQKGSSSVLSPSSTQNHCCFQRCTTRAQVRFHVLQLCALWRSACPLGFKGLEARECRLVSCVSLFCGGGRRCSFFGVSFDPSSSVQEARGSNQWFLRQSLSYSSCLVRRKVHLGEGELDLGGGLSPGGMEPPSFLFPISRLNPRSS